MTAFTPALNSALLLDQSATISNSESLDSCYAVSALAAASMGAVGSAVANLLCDLNLTGALPRVRVDRALASRWFAQSIYPIEWQVPPAWDALAGDYKSKDGWIKLHTNLPHHRCAALEALDVEGTRERVTAVIKNHNSNELETLIVSHGGAAAALRSREEWNRHAQGQAVAGEPLVAWSTLQATQVTEWPATRARPLSNLRVLDLTRVLAGPVATRTLAGLGANVLRVDPPGWNEAIVVPDVTLGKRCCTLDLHQNHDRDRFEELLSTAHILVHGYRPDALAGLGYGEKQRQMLAPNLIEVSLDAYGWTGPWSMRRGFDSLIQMSCGIAHAGMLNAKSNRPVPLPVQALDHATGYLMAAAVIRALSRAVTENNIHHARLSLARTADLLICAPQSGPGTLSTAPKPVDFTNQIELTPWGRAHRLRPAISIDGTPMKWERPACNLGSSDADWT